ncbi:hypothetical protein GOBAR_AA15050 [Gossypium barbadense]|uniref:Uncharacterized protein n=1 Tax=Gossypium barbadense TaxID=3634 RepID=A0A2P5XQI2_GOSBA|nr:hypothetical protein GOBAR_AA15050 [Gossypium barbadense]
MPPQPQPALMSLIRPLPHRMASLASPSPFFSITTIPPFSIDLPEDLFQLLHVRPLGLGRCIDWAALEQVGLADELMMSSHDKYGTITFRLGGLVRDMSVPAFGAALDISTDEFMGVTSLSPALRYIHALLAHALTGRRESTGVVSTTDAYYLWSMATGHIFDLAYFIALVFHHQTDHHRKGPIFLGPYETRLARHFGLLDKIEQSSTLTLIGQMSPQGISSMIHMRMIKW